MQDLNDKVTGNSLTAPEWNEVPSEIQNVIEGLGITLSGADLNQLGKAVAGYVANGQAYADTGAANAYVLTTIGLKQQAPAYTDGYTCLFRAGNTNTGTSTANVGGLGVKSIKDRDGQDLRPGMISTGTLTMLVFDASNNWFELVEIGQRAELTSGDINGLLWSNNVTDVINDFDISAGACRSTDDTTDLYLTAGQTKRMDAAWATGTNAGALATGATAWAAGVSYHVFIGVISGVVEIIVDSDAAAANAIANNGLTKPRHIFSFLADTGPALPVLFTEEVGQSVRAVLDVRSVDVSNTGNTSGALATLSVPTGLEVLANVVYYIALDGTAKAILTETRQTNSIPTGDVFDLTTTGSTATPGTIMRQLKTDISGQVRYRTSILTTSHVISLISYVFIR